MNLIKKIQENVFRHELFGRGASAKGGSASGGKIVVGVSGGPDSVCLLDALYKLKNKYDLEIIVAHVNYSLRGKDSEKDEALVKKIAEKYSLPVEIKNVQRSAFSVLRIIFATFATISSKKSAKNTAPTPSLSGITSTTRPKPF